MPDFSSAVALPPPIQWSGSPPGVVPGMRFRFPADELAEHLKARAEYHRKRAVEKDTQHLPNARRLAEAMKADRPKVPSISNMSKSGGYNNDPDTQVEQLEADIRDHLAKALSFEWLAAHLFAADYCLDKNDLATLEVIRHV